MRLWRIVHDSVKRSPLTVKSTSGRYHLGEQEARATSYFSFDQATCLKEVTHHLGGIVPLRDMIAMEFDIDVNEIVDLTQDAVRRELGVRKNMLTAEDYNSTQTLARKLRSQGVQAAICPSARDRRAQNVVLFLDNIDRGAIRKTREVRLE